MLVYRLTNTWYLVLYIRSSILHTCGTTIFEHHINEHSLLRPMTMQARCSKVIFLNYSKKKPVEDTLSYRRYGEHGKKMFVFLGLFVHAAVRGGTCDFTLKLSTRSSKTAHATIGLRSGHRNNPRPTRFVSGKASECR